MERGGEKDWSSLETRGCGFHDSFDSSTAGAGGAGRKRGRTRWDHFSLFPQKTSPGFHDPSAVPGPPVTRAAGQDGADGTMDLGSARPPLSRACLPKLVCLSTSLFLQRDCGQNCKAPLQSHTRDKPTRASFKDGGLVGVAGKARGWLAADGSHPLPLFCRHRSLARGGHLQQTCRPARIYTGGLFQG